jgi:hypothetical protein
VGTSGGASGNVEEYRVSTIRLQTAVRTVAIAIGVIAEGEGEKETNGNVRTKGTMMCLLLSDSAECLVLRVEQVPVCVVRNNLVLDDLRNTCEVATELLKHFPYEQRTVTRLTI